MLGPGAVVIFLARPAALLAGGQREAALALLTDGERARLDRFRFERDRDVALASRALERRALAAVTGIEAAAWRFVTRDDGRPAIAAPAGTDVAWNVANTVGLVACAVTRGRAIGVDVEPIRADAPADVVDSHFAPAERAALRALALADQPRRFVELWTLKEAYVKARSLGLSAPLDRFAFDPATTPPGFRPLPDDATAWQVEQWWPTDQHCAALCVERDRSLAIERRWLDQ